MPRITGPALYGPPGSYGTVNTLFQEVINQQGGTLSPSHSREGERERVVGKTSE